MDLETNRNQWDSRRIAAERRKFKRIVIAFQDLEDVRASVTRLLGLNAEPPIDAADRAVTGALITAIIVGYGRCFTPARGHVQVLARLPDQFENSLSPHLRELHTRMVQLRHKEFAHSDSETADVTVSALPDFRNGALMPSARRLRRDSLSESELREIPLLLGELHIYLYDELVRLNESLARYGDF